MPGMMDTVLDIGLNDEVVEGMVAATHDERFVLDSYRRLIQMFGSVVLDVPDEPFQAVLTSKRHARSVDSDSDYCGRRPFPGYVGSPRQQRHGGATICRVA